VLNGLPADRHQIIVGDFFRVAGRLRSQSRLFDCVILDPPYFSTTDAGKVDLQHGTTRLVNKIRPLVAHEGWLIVINNALFLHGTDFMSELERLCQSQYLVFDSILPVPSDVTGYPETIVDQPPFNPAPFNHPTKMAVLKVFRKDLQK
jgi:23S rRNA (cytosine1962-C5)-methyltransferase